MDENTYASQAIFKPPPRTTWMKNIHDDLSALDLGVHVVSSWDFGIHEARDLVQNQPLCRLMSLHSATHS